MDCSGMNTAGTGADEAFDYLFKIVLIGDSNIGKTCVVHRFKTGVFIEKQQNTIGVDFIVKTLDIEGKKVKMLPDLLRNKADLKERREVPFEEACNVAEKFGLLAVLETSAKEAQNVEEAFLLMTRELLARNGLHLSNEHAQSVLHLDSRPVSAAVTTEKNSCSCSPH
ncbi:ras-related protein Rab-19-like [Heterodontus francisci]|uniref:ras-related protein Rab-19-like n=1 Tax=Heterodontus francisci TaxID=7792 RepID=UPI00355C0CFC